MKKSQTKSCFIFILLTFLMAFIIYAVSTTLTPENNYVDDDGFLELMGTCIPTADNYVDTSWNITNATLWSNVDGTWKANETLQTTTKGNGNATHYFNFTSINSTAEGKYLWNVQCFEQNRTSTEVNSAFAGNNTIIVTYARPTVSINSPADGSYDLDGENILVNCSATPSTGWNLSYISVMTYVNGTTWLHNSTETVPAGNTGTEYTFRFIVNSTITGDGDLTFSCFANQSHMDSWYLGMDSNLTSDNSAANRTLNIERPPTITLNNPADNNWSKNKRVNLSFLVSSVHGTSAIAPFPCQIWTNETGVWTTKTGTINVVNNTYQDQYVDFQEKTAIQWGVKCQDANDGNVWNMSDNRTINIDTVNPTITGIIPATNNTYSNGTIDITFTATDTNIHTAIIYFDTFDTANLTNTTIVSGLSTVYHDLLNHSITDKYYNFSLWVNDSAGRTFQTTNYSIIVDRTEPSITNFLNYSYKDYCDQRNITWDANESTNHTVYFDTDTDVSDGDIFRSGTFEINHSVIFDFDYSGEILYYMNVTVCDQAYNCNYSQRTFTTPARVCQGWSQYAIYDGLINLSVVQNQSGADLVYFWNATNQNWVYFTAGLTSNGHVDVGRRTDYQVVHLYENTNSTWFRNQTNDGFYTYNVTSTHNFVSVPIAYNFGNFTDTFMNTSHEYPSFINTTHTDGIDYGPFNITYFAGYNNSAQDYVSHIFNFSWSNETILEPCPSRTYPVTCMETAWVASGFNVSWNTSAIYANWTI